MKPLPVLSCHSERRLSGAFRCSAAGLTRRHHVSFVSEGISAFRSFENSRSCYIYEAMLYNTALIPQTVPHEIQRLETAEQYLEAETE